MAGPAKMETTKDGKTSAGWKRRRVWVILSVNLEWFLCTHDVFLFFLTALSNKMGQTRRDHILLSIISSVQLQSSDEACLQTGVVCDLSAFSS